MKRSLVCVLSVLALALSAPVMAQSEQSASGKVVSITSNQLVISTADGKQITFMMDNNTTRPSNVAQGSNVTVRYHDMSGTFHAANVAASSGTTDSATTGTATGMPGSTATGTSATSANAQDRGTTADPTGNDARNTRTTAEDVTGASGTRTSGTATGATTPTRPTGATATTTTTQRETDETPATTATTGTTTAMDQDTGTGRLPATASPLPLMGLSGLLALAGGLGMRVIRRRS